MKLENSKEDLIVCIRSAMLEGADWMALLVVMPEHPAPQLIIDPKENFTARLNFLRNTYNENLEHAHNPAVRIVGFSSGSSISKVSKIYKLYMKKLQEGEK
ncbi:hypothetical protein SHANETTE_210 [Bacillus phage Shanette]|uniref:Uncharacterized protein n=2 Tax=Siminovitchvirus TaxID=1918721 RepID=S5MAS3_9CAUD|nr:hypothetical protein AVV47_gp086 [Bacillus phage JL]YP_009216205.1 hypothetical protein AVV46_gp087 [Bacillus phage Shanette]AGR46874.1 hypothetical protein JL_210 [Bacillus phage JL]AGR47100.1 hypothetical protein SHANETTE_210 [Bacillus phage Shanette]